MRGGRGLRLVEEFVEDSVVSGEAGGEVMPDAAGAVAGVVNGFLVGDVGFFLDGDDDDEAGGAGGADGGEGLVVEGFVIDGALRVGGGLRDLDADGVGTGLTHVGVFIRGIVVVGGGPERVVSFGEVGGGNFKGYLVKAMRDPGAAVKKELTALDVDFRLCGSGEREGEKKGYEKLCEGQENSCWFFGADTVCAEGGLCYSCGSLHFVILVF